MHPLQNLFVTLYIIKAKKKTLIEVSVHQLGKHEIIADSLKTFAGEEQANGIIDKAGADWVVWTSSRPGDTPSLKYEMVLREALKNTI